MMKIAIIVQCIRIVSSEINLTQSELNLDGFNNSSYISDCIIAPSSIDDFPKSPFSKSQLQRGAVGINIICAIYFFICLAFICDKYFIPTIERICTILKISPDVAATTFMATATTMPEFFANSVSTFVAESDMGLSAIIGSTMFNTLGVAACASFFISKPIQIDWWPLTRDSILLIAITIVLVSIAWDGIIMWWETCILVTIYVLYWIVMFQNKIIMKSIKNVVENNFKWCQRIKNFDIENQRPKASSDENVKEDGSNRNSNCLSSQQENEVKPTESHFEVNNDEIWKIPSSGSKFAVIWFGFTWPIRFLLHYTIPDPRKHKKLFPISFFMCIMWIGLTSYVIFWMIVIIGDTFNVPESVMGLTFLAFGGCMPEAISAIIVARKGSGQMGVSNALGANCLAILFSLGVPWFITTMIKGAWTTNAHIVIYSYGMEYTMMFLILAVVTLFTILAIHGYKLRRKVGIYLLISYIVFATFAILMEYNVFLVGAPANC